MGYHPFTPYKSTAPQKQVLVKFHSSTKGACFYATPPTSADVMYEYIHVVVAEPPNMPSLHKLIQSQKFHICTPPRPQAKHQTKSNQIIKCKSKHFSCHQSF